MHHVDRSWRPCSAATISRKTGKLRLRTFAFDNTWSFDQNPTSTWLWDHVRCQKTQITVRLLRILRTFRKTLLVSQASVWGVKSAWHLHSWNFKSSRLVFHVDGRDVDDRHVCEELLRLWFFNAAVLSLVSGVSSKLEISSINVPPKLDPVMFAKASLLSVPTTTFNEQAPNVPQWAERKLTSALIKQSS